ncbi:glycosyl transferase [Rathayibacter sp. AY2B7]|uniref:glycosyltransferase family 2 protein n=1 Tax=unclassified Rathayibacter TaxID=2609250 RepID=UPI000CE905B4|nr:MULTISPECIES: glycosyltransferase [unclassified Rathayibacter]PPF12156.1 glycosyl transferase [Rathayibacter sp. AY1A5]PPG64259.1 glycosyl transferase [Rathayibacter sp. AY2B7]
MSAPEPRVGVVVLTQGTRPDDLAAGLAGVLAQEGVELDVVCVGNGWEPDGLPEGVRALALPENLGIPAGRNAGVDAVAGEYLFFLDDDARIPSPRFLVDAIALLASNRRIGLVQPRVDSTDGTPSPRRWIPRILKGDPRRSGPVFSVWEGAVVLRRDVFARTGGWAAPFFYAHEGIELAWRVWDTGRTAWYAGELVAQHPVIQPTRHADYYRLNARNRVWLARRNLAAPLALVYVASWTAIQCLRWRRDPAALRAWFAGWREGWRSDPGGRRVLSARTVLRMAFAGRPPIV